LEGAHQMSELDLPEKIWTLQSMRTKNHLVHILPLTDRVIEIIDQLPRLDGDLLFSITGRIAVTSFHYAKGKLDSIMNAEVAKVNPDFVLKPWVWHDLRRTAKTLMSICGVRPHISERVLGHRIAGVEGVYDRYSYLDEKRVALEKLAAMLERIVNLLGDNVVSLRA
jgi:integrase